VLLDVEHDLSDCNDLDWRRLDSAQQPFDARNQHARTEPLAQVVVRSRVERREQVVFALVSVEDHDGQPRAAPQLPAELDSIEEWRVVEQRKIRRLEFEQLQRAGSVGSHAALVAGLAQREGEQCTQLGILIGQQDLHLLESAAYTRGSGVTRK